MIRVEVQESCFYFGLEMFMARIIIFKMKVSKHKSPHCKPTSLEST